MEEIIEKQIERIKEMTILYDQIYEFVTKGAKTSEKIEDFRLKINELEAYYQGPEWREDFDADREGKIPKELNRWILTEDAIYDLLCTIDEDKDFMEE